MGAAVVPRNDRATLTNRRFGRSRRTPPPNPPWGAITSAAQVAAAKIYKLRFARHDFVHNDWNENELHCRTALQMRQRRNTGFLCANKK
jgi:hypothetical protein